MIITFDTDSLYLHYSIPCFVISYILFVLLQKYLLHNKTNISYTISKNSKLKKLKKLDYNIVTDHDPFSNDYSNSLAESVPTKAGLRLVKVSKNSSMDFKGRSKILEACGRGFVVDSEIQTLSSNNQVRITWETPPRTVLIIKKWYDEKAKTKLLEIANWLIKEKNMRVLVELSTKKEIPYLETFNIEEIGELNKIVDFVICLGGDGTILHAAALFDKAVPPIVPFNMGTLGFLTPFDSEDYKKDITSVLHGNFHVTLRSRLVSKVIRADNKDKNKHEYHVLNEVVIYRGPASQLSNLECYCDDIWITRVLADGIIIATATGSTAYSLSAGGSIVHPSVPGILFTPVSPHSLSFRPLLFPDCAEIKIKVASDSQHCALVSFDGHDKVELRPSDAVVICSSAYPVPTINKTGQIHDWFKSLARCLHWNERAQQLGKETEHKNE